LVNGSGCLVEVDGSSVVFVGLAVNSAELQACVDDHGAFTSSVTPPALPPGGADVDFACGLDAF
jgi:hypothetical protein